ncbi:9708_t:CDS:2 [Scutellospora calospora]|uniref:9708_t:CDS:1 n=1 Tax=Scutellospora calospora TaxID=85575 RepID=A0ACA9LS87_9GLOM|nr:9708_t:CDS:2 [Scutellospora calospora]
MSEKPEIQLELTNYELAIEDDKMVTSLQQKKENNEHQEVNVQENLKSSELKKENNNVAPMRNFYVISFGYIFFTLTDSGLRMIVLLELYDRHFNALQISIMFTLYEFFGVIINLTGGIIQNRQ